jgi:hypothetical protein
MESGQDAAEALKPTAQDFFIVALTTKRVGAGNAVIDMRRDCFYRLIPAMVVTWSKVCRIRFLTM